MSKATKLFPIIASVAKEKCPNCNQAKAFHKSGGLLHIPVMKEECSECKYRFEREPGYFIGAMYVSYGLAILIGILTYVIAILIAPEMPLMWRVALVIASIFLFAKKNFKWSRLLYLYIFPW